MQNEGMINVQIARIDDTLSRIARLESASTSTFTTLSWSTGATTRRDNIVSKKGLKNVANFVTIASAVTDAEFHQWANGSGHNQLDLEWSLKQLSCVPNQAKATSEVHEPGNEFRSTLLA